MNLNNISSLLEENMIISNKSLFKIWIKLSLNEKNLKFGEYKILKKSSINDLTNIFLKGKSVNRYITIPEGISKFDLMQILNKTISDSSSEDFEYLPNILVADTYSYSLNDRIEDIVKNINNKSYNRIITLWNERSEFINLKSIEEWFILASIVEKESSKKSEKNKIAGVFFNRLSINMRLQSDPTVIYGMKMGRKLDRKLLTKDLKVDNPYNTYTNHGLPPKPICIPGIDSLIAVLNPYKSNFYYFVADKKGGHLFSETFDEHKSKIIDLKKKVRFNE